VRGFFRNEIARMFVAILVFVFAALILCNPCVRALNYGDVNHDGVVDVRDVVLVMRHILDLEIWKKLNKSWPTSMPTGRLMSETLP